MSMKYSSKLAERLELEWMDGASPDEEHGDVDRQGHLAWFSAESVVLFTDSFGFVDAVEGIDEAAWGELLTDMRKAEQA
jgi:hypothetical protein